MNTDCQWYRDDDGGTCCGEPTVRGRTHCEAHREIRATQLFRKREQARRAAETAEQDYFFYLQEGYGP